MNLKSGINILLIVYFCFCLRHIRKCNSS